MEVLFVIKKWTELDGVSGCEKVIRDAIINEIKPYCDNCYTDNMGNLIVEKYAIKNSENAPTVILSAHMDEVGLIVTDITDGGMLKFDTVGGITTSVLLSCPVRCKDIKGVIGTIPPHLMPKDKKSEDFELEDLFIDIGVKSKEEVKKVIQKGDTFAFDSSYTEFGDGLIKAKALDDRLGVAIMLDIIKESYPANLKLVFTVQEETGLRGAKSACAGLEADFAIVIESTAAQDVIGTRQHEKVTKLGYGAALSVMDRTTIYDEELLRTLISLAKENNIKYQIKMAATGGNDAGEIHISNGGTKTCAVSVPTRYIHSPSDIISIYDFDCVLKLVKAFLKEPFIKGDELND